jgi:hypothetical protein
MVSCTIAMSQATIQHTLFRLLIPVPCSGNNVHASFKSIKHVLFSGRKHGHISGNKVFGLIQAIKV